MGRIILGIDPGTVVTGYGILEGEGRRIRILACGVLQLGKSAAEHPEKLRRIFERVSSLIRDYQPQEMALEAPFFGKNPQSMLKLGRAQGAAMTAGLVAGLPVFEYAPRKVKTAVTGKGTASKELVAQVLRQTLGFEESPQFLDATDALAVALCHYHQGASQAPKSAKNWADFIARNPERLRKRGEESG